MYIFSGLVAEISMSYCNEFIEYILRYYFYLLCVKELKAQAFSEYLMMKYVMLNSPVSQVEHRDYMLAMFMDTEVYSE